MCAPPPFSLLTRGNSAAEFYANGNLIGSDTTSPFSIAWAGPAPGAYTLTAKAVDDLNAETTSAPRSVTITAANAAPTAAITSPANNAKFNAPANVTINASAAAPEANDSVARVEFYVNGNLVATDTASPYSYVANALAAGTYILTVKSVDSFNAETVSVARTIVVSDTNAPPTVSLTSPPNNAAFTLPVTITVSANASAVEANGSITQVEFFANGVSIGIDTTSPYSIAWNPTVGGTYALTARATDNLGAQTTSAARTVVLTAPNQPPSVSLTSPANGASFNAPAIIALAADASDSDGTVTQVQFYEGANLIATVTTPPYTYDWMNVAQGSYTLTAKATDNLNATTTSSPISITVNANTTATIFYIYTDQLNTPRAITNEAATTVWKWDNVDPFGANAPNEDPDADSNLFVFNLRFPGQYFDKETNTHYNYMRDYDPSIGRYVQSDPIGIAGLLQREGILMDKERKDESLMEIIPRLINLGNNTNNYQIADRLGVNLYAYVDANPLGKRDSLGLASWAEIEIATKIVTGLGVGAWSIIKPQPVNCGCGASSSLIGAAANFTSAYGIWKFAGPGEVALGGIGVVAAGVGGWELGTWINYQIECSAFGGKRSVGTWIYDLSH